MIIYKIWVFYWNSYDLIIVVGGVRDYFNKSLNVLLVINIDICMQVVIFGSWIVYYEGKIYDIKVNLKKIKKI